MKALTHSIEIETTPERIWTFFTNLEENYKLWHPEDHVQFEWIEGNPMELGSKIYAEEYVMGKLKKYKATVDEIIPNEKIVFKCKFPISILTPKFLWQIEQHGPTSVFTAITYMKWERFFHFLMRKRFDELIEIGKKHMEEEGENLKKLLEERKE